MGLWLHAVVTGTLLLIQGLFAIAQQPAEISAPSVVQAALIAPGSIPFHLKATITEEGDPNSKAVVEMYWVSEKKWRRTIQSEDFSQTLIVNGDKVSEEDSEDYFPIGLQTLVTAMVDPKPILDAWRPGDAVRTKANGASSESGEVCYASGICARSNYGLLEIVEAAGHSIEFMDYKTFRGKRIARRLVHTRSPGDSMTAQVTELSELKHPDENLFEIHQATAEEKRIHQVVMPQPELRSQAVESHDIVWPQALDGATTGSASFYVSVDPSGQVREVVPVKTANERTNESACRQLMRWKFKPITKDGMPAQAESLLTFILNTRAFGPAAPLSDAEVRKLASNIIEPVIPPGAVPAGATYTLRVAIDSDGRLIEAIGGEGPHELNIPCYQAVSKWQLKPFLQNGEPMPYRAEITCRVP
ncbi:MAG: hypothetical protein WCE73_15035 [Candidatus Angelobacter sp.]